MRLLLLLLVTLPLATASRAQTNCQGGNADGYPCDGVDLLAHLPLTTFGSSSNNANDIWGWTDPQNGNEYALVGLENGTAFVDITTPTAPVYLGRLPTATSSSTWRDIKTYADHAFIVSEASSHGMQVFDLTRLRSVSSPPVTFTADARYTGFGSAHNIVIDTDSGFAYAVGADRCSGGLEMVNIQNPTSPTDAGCYGSDGYTHDAQCVTYHGPDADYTGHELCLGAQGTFFGDNHVNVVDVTNKSNPVLVSRGYYTNAGYTHQGWFTDDQRYFLVDDEVDDGASSTTRTIVFDMTDLDNPEFAFFYYGPVETTDHNLYVRGRYAYLSNYEGGLRIVDLDGIDTGALAEVAFFDTYPQGNGESYSGQWSNYPFFPSGTVVANDRSNGLFVLRPNLEQPVAVTVDIEPVGGPITIPAAGGPFSYTATLTNTSAQSQTLDAWVVAFLPNGNEYGSPLAGPRSVTLAPGQTLGPLTLSRTVPAAAPAGEYTVELRAGDYPSGAEATDSFTFTKAAAAEAVSASAELAFGTYPNPFADRTTVRFALDAPAEVRLAVYDALGREVAVLVDGALGAGPQEAVFEADALPNGTYFVLLEAGEHVERHTLTLLR